MNKIDLLLTRQRLLPEHAEAFVSDTGAGALVCFLGKVRNQTAGKAVLRLEFEAYEKMALQEMQKIAETAIQHYGIHKIAIHHRLGVLAIGEVAVAIAVSSAHRQAAFSACAFAIDTLKQTVPIWKKEIFEDGESWVSAHP